MMEHPHPNNMAAFLTALEHRCGQRTLLKYMAGSQVLEMDGQEFFRLVRRCGARLRRHGLANRHIAIMGANRWQWMAYLCAVFQIGGVAVLMAPDLDGQELSQRAAQTDVSCILHDASLSEAVIAADQIPRLSMDDPLSDDPDAAAPAQPDPESLACILFTSGTTARCKAVMLSHRATVAGICHNVIGIPFRAQLAILPLHHIAGFASVLNTWYLDRVICLGEEYKHLFRYLEAMKPDYTLTVPSLLQVILKKLKKGGPNGQLIGWDLHLIGCGGAKFQPEVIQALNDRNIRVLQSYGATEAGGLGFDWEMTPQCRDTIGKPCPEIQTKIVDGELFLRSDSVMMGYYGDPEATAQVLIDGWYATGDLCTQDADGFLRLTGRRKNLIILSNGENISPEEIESRLSGHPDICEVLISAENDRLCAWIFPNQGEADPPEALAQIRARIRQALERYNDSVPTYKQVHSLHFHNEPFAKTQVGKMIRNTALGVKQP